MAAVRRLYKQEKRGQVTKWLQGGVDYNYPRLYEERVTDGFASSWRRGELKVQTALLWEDGPLQLALNMTWDVDEMCGILRSGKHILRKHN